jgi:hypothetical protein
MMLSSMMASSCFLCCECVCVRCVWVCGLWCVRVCVTSVLWGANFQFMVKIDLI